MVEQDYGILRKGTTVRNPQANSILERIHLTLGNIINFFEINDSEMIPKSPWDGILSANMFALSATYHTTLQATPMQLVFNKRCYVNCKIPR